MNYWNQKLRITKSRSRITLDRHIENSGCRITIFEKQIHHRCFREFKIRFCCKDQEFQVEGEEVLNRDTCDKLKAKQAIDSEFYTKF